MITAPKRGRKPKPVDPSAKRGSSSSGRHPPSGRLYFGNRPAKDALTCLRPNPAWSGHGCPSARSHPDRREPEVAAGRESCACAHGRHRHGESDGQGRAFWAKLISEFESNGGPERHAAFATAVSQLPGSLTFRESAVRSAPNNRMKFEQSHRLNFDVTAASRRRLPTEQSWGKVAWCRTRRR